MSLNKYESEFLTELSENQQEMVSGGNVDIYQDTDYHLLHLKKFEFESAVSKTVSGPGGSATYAAGVDIDKFSLLDIDTAGSTDINVS